MSYRQLMHCRDSKVCLSICCSCCACSLVTRRSGWMTTATGQHMRSTPELSRRTSSVSASLTPPSQSWCVHSLNRQHYSARCGLLLQISCLSVSLSDLGAAFGGKLWWEPCIRYRYMWHTVVERRSLAGKHSLSHAQPAADGWPLLWVDHLLQVTQPVILSRSINE